ncbi:MAG: hydantoinase, partial [Planctomycetaceae bacterium]|nr:hydantoinase [Planctomycetaceae bacterium]
MEWQFWIDVGGTFTDCIGFGPQGRLVQKKVLSSATVHGRGVLSFESSDRLLIADSNLRLDPDGFWKDAQCTLLDNTGCEQAKGTVSWFDAANGSLQLSPISDLPTLKTVSPGPVKYLLQPRWPAPVLAIRSILRLSSDQPCPAVSVRFGTTRGTNALLTRTGARTLLVTTKGFSDAPLIGNQSRPDLFALNITKPAPLFCDVIEVDERISSTGRVLYNLAADELKRLEAQLTQRRHAGIQSVAICLMNAYANDLHEKAVEQLARQAGFSEVSRSTEVSPLIRFIPRCDTSTLDAYLNPVLREYLQAVEEHLPGSHVQVMTSTGGLVASGNFRGR